MEFIGEIRNEGNRLMSIRCNSPCLPVYKQDPRGFPFLFGFVPVSGQVSVIAPNPEVWACNDPHY